MLTKDSTIQHEQQPIRSPFGTAAKAASYFFDSSANNDVNPALKRINLLGERNSGTNFLNEALLQAFPTYARGVQAFQNEIPVLDYKHMVSACVAAIQRAVQRILCCQESVSNRILYQLLRMKGPLSLTFPPSLIYIKFLHELLNETQLHQLSEASHDRVFVMMVRSPCDWAVSMKKKPWHLCRLDGTFCDRGGVNTGSFANDTLAEFWQTPLIDYGELLVAGNNLDVNATYGSVLQIRAHKLRLMQQVREVAANIRVVHFRDFEAAPHRTIVELKEEFGLKASKWYEELPPSKKLHRHPCLKEADHSVLMEMIDWEIEAQFGFFPSDCRTCAAPLRKKKTRVTTPK